MTIRQESKKIFAVVKQHFKVVQVASIDEAFIDLTQEVEQEMSKKEVNFELFGTVMGQGENDTHG